MTVEPEAVLADRPVPHVLRLTLNRPEARNAIDGRTTQALAAALALSEADDDIRCVVLTAAGDKAFCAGADLKAISGGRIRELVTPEGGFAGLARARRTKPWIAAVGGPALAGGCELALSCDMIVASESASFGLPEVKRGLAALAGGLYRLPRALPRALAMEMVATGDPISASQAFAHGLVNRLVVQDRVQDEAIALAARIAANAPVAVRESLIVARSAFDLTEGELESASDQMGRRLAETEDYREGPLAFIEKRQPVWLGR